MTMLAVINEEQCIGCTKCIKACPVDAIIGSENWMHTVISEECIGCKLCIPPCPVDCIEMLPAASNFIPKPKEFILNRAKAKKARDNQDNSEIIKKLEQNSQESKQDYIKAALSRIKNKKKQ